MKKVLVIILAVTLANFAHAAISLGGDFTITEGEDAEFDIASSSTSPWIGYLDLHCYGTSRSVTRVPECGPDAFVLTSPGYECYYMLNVSDGAQTCPIVAGVQFNVSISGLTEGTYDIELYDDTFWETVDGLTITVLGPAITVLSPNGGETLQAGTTDAITWEGPGVSGNVKLEYSTNNGAGWTDITASTANDGQYDWTVPAVTSGQCLVRVSDASDAGVNDESDGVFNIYVCEISTPADMDGNCEVGIADILAVGADWLRNGNPFSSECSEPLPIIWIHVDDPGFSGYMSKYETTNAQYCQFLNAALASGDIIVDANDIVYGADGSNAGADYVGELYLVTYESYAGCPITYSDGTFSVLGRDGYDMNNHPVIAVSYYGAAAFCNYYGWVLPTEAEWQAVADYDGTFTYGCGMTIDHSKANYDFDNPLGFSSYPYISPVNRYPSYGYGMNDMTGNVWDWTATVSGSDHICRGGSWHFNSSYCTVSSQVNGDSATAYSDVGFRACR